MGGKYEIRGAKYPFEGHYDIVVFTDSWFKARRYYRKTKKMFYRAFIVRNDKRKGVGLGEERW